MPETRQFVVHTLSRVLWPARKSLEEVLALKASTPDDIWQKTYMGAPSPPGGTIFKRSWWDGPGRRFDLGEPRWSSQCIGRWMAFDTALKEKETNDYTAWVIGELMPDYKLNIVLADHERLAFPDLHDKIVMLAKAYNRDRKLRQVIIEDRASGTSVIQTLRAASDVAHMITPFVPHQSKEVRGKQVSIWCREGAVRLPYPNDHAPWLLDAMDEWLLAPSAPHDDIYDSFVMLLLYLEGYLSQGLKARMQQRNDAQTAPHNADPALHRL